MGRDKGRGRYVPVAIPRGGRLLGSTPKAPKFFFSFPLPILSTLHPNTILEPNL